MTATTRTRKTRAKDGGPGEPVSNDNTASPLNRANGAANVTKRGDRVQKMVLDSEAAQAEIDAIMEKARKACQPHRDEIKAIATAAAEEGVPKKVFGTVLKQRRLRAKADAAPQSLNEDQLEDYRIITDELADFLTTPLGAATAEAAAAE